MCWLLAVLLQSQPPAAPVPDLPVSLERIRRGLEQPPIVTVISEPGMPPRFRVAVQERLDIGRLWREDLPVPTFVRPSRGLTHHEFLGAVTPELFRSTSQHPCCDVLPAIEALGSAITRSARSRAVSRTKREIKKELEALEKARRAQAATDKDR